MILRNILIKIVSVLVFFNAVTVSAEQVCKISYKDYPTSLDGTTLEVPSNTVSMSESVTVKQPDDSSAITFNSPAICFMIDNSVSMFKSYEDDKGAVFQPLDPKGNRFTVTSSLVDTLYKKNPNCEVALVIFGTELHYKDEKGITDYIGSIYKGNYVKYTKLNGLYTMDGKKYTGYELIKYFLETKDTTIKKGSESFTFTTIKNKSYVEFGFGSNTGTDIDLAFEAVRKNLSNTKIDKEDQFNIFLSDGIPSDSTKINFSKGENFPTTYTVFFSPDKTAPDLINTMNENIKNNGYSSSNEKSEMWAYDNSSHDALLNFIIENVLNKKMSIDITTKPFTISVNGKANNEWIDGGFQFAEQFPLTGEVTPFTFDINYILKTNSSDGKELIDTVNKKVDFSVERQNSPNLKDSLVVEYWDRTINFYENGKEITALNENSKEIELRFLEKKVDVNYRYKDVEIVLTSRDMGDELTITLDEKDAHNFQNSFTIDFKATSADKGDNILQISPKDEIRAFFKNPLLPLDTLTAILGTDIINLLTFNEAVYFDKDANGFVDLIDLHYTSKLPPDQSMKENLIKLVSLPSFRNFQVDESVLNGEKLTLKVTERRDEFQTYSSEDDKIFIAAKAFGILEVEKHELPVVDSIAPILEKGSVHVVKHIDRVELTARFSEKILLEENSKPLNLYHANGSKYECSMKKKENDDKIYTFTINEGGGDIVSGDSANINFSNNIVGDENGNWQRNEDNSKREIIIEITNILDFDKAIYFDKDANGFVDLIDLYYTSKLPLDKSMKETLIDLISLPSFRSFEVGESILDEKKLTLKVTENRDEFQTYCSDEDKIAIAEKSFDTLKVNKHVLSVVDSIAPILEKGAIKVVKYIDKVELTASFSENIKLLENNEPLYLYHANGSKYESAMQEKVNEDKTYTFTVYEGGDDIVSGDSANINFSNNIVGDEMGNWQRKEGNSKREITVLRQMRLSDAAYHDRNADGHPDEITLKVEKRKGGEEINLEKLLELISLPDFRQFEVDKDALSIDDDIITIAVKEKREDINTACTEDDKLSVSSGSMDSYFINDSLPDETMLEIIDSMAPVIKSNPVLYVNSLEEGAVDSISVQFSENIETINDEHPLRFFRDENVFIGDLSVLSSEDDRVSFEVNGFNNNISDLIDGDSVNINYKVYDLNGTEQRNENNIKRPISIRVVLPDIDVKLYAVTPYVVSETIIPDKVLGMVDNPDEYALIETDSGYAGCLIMTGFEPKTVLEKLEAEVKGTLTVYDKVGNRVVDAVEMEFVPELGELVFIWNGTNNLGRSVGGDVFKAVAMISVMFQGASKIEFRVERLISSQVKRNSSGSDEE